MSEGAGSASRSRPPFSYLLVHSPLVGPSSWEPVAAVLRARGSRVALPGLAEALAAVEHRHDALAAAAVDGLGTGPWLVVVHSGAGALVPSLVTALRGAAAAVVFVDALLPHPGRSWAAGAPADLVDALRARVDDAGLLPSWDTWFGPDTLTELIPDAASRARVTADLPRVPLALLEATAPLHPGWDSTPCGYLQLSDAYAGDTAEATHRGWPTTRLDGHHLSPVTDPTLVAAAVETLATAVSTTPR